MCFQNSSALCPGHFEELLASKAPLSSSSWCVSGVLRCAQSSQEICDSKNYLFSSISSSLQKKRDLKNINFVQNSCTIKCTFSNFFPKTGWICNIFAPYKCRKKAFNHIYKTILTKKLYYRKKPALNMWWCSWQTYDNPMTASKKHENVVG